MKTRSLKIAKPQVDYKAIQARALASIGFSSKYIAKLTGLTRSEIFYRLRTEGVKITDFRNGKSRVAKIVSKNVLHYSDQIESENYNKVKLLA